MPDNDRDAKLFFDGRLDEMRIHNRVLTEAEVEQVIADDLEPITYAGALGGGG